MRFATQIYVLRLRIHASVHDHNGYTRMPITDAEVAIDNVNKFLVRSIISINSGEKF